MNRELRADPCLRTHRIVGDDRISQIEASEHQRDGGDFVGFLLRRLPCQNQRLPGGPGGDQVQGFATLLRIVAPPGRFAVDCNQLRPRRIAKLFNPGKEAGLELLRIDRGERVGVSLKQLFADTGCRGHNGPAELGFRVLTAGQKRGVAKQIGRLMRRRAAVEPVIGHVNAEHRMGRHYLRGSNGDATNAVLAAVGYNLSLLLRWLGRVLWVRVVLLIVPAMAPAGHARAI